MVKKLIVVLTIYTTVIHYVLFQHYKLSYISDSLPYQINLEIQNSEKPLSQFELLLSSQQKESQDHHKQ